MEEFYYYKGFGVKYMQITGTTEVIKNGSAIKRYWRLGQLDGANKAMKYIDELTKEQNNG